MEGREGTEGKEGMHPPLPLGESFNFPLPLGDLARSKGLGGSERSAKANRPPRRLGGRGEGDPHPAHPFRPFRPFRPFPPLCLVTDRAACLGRPLELVVAEAVAAGVGLVQLREKDLSARELLDLGGRLLGPIREAGAALVVNDRVDVALALGADGVHLGSGSLPARDARRLVGDRALVGVSTHSIEEVVRAESDGADYVVLGTIFETRSHPGVKGAGPGLLKEAAETVRIPVLAIGGVTPSNARAVMEAGASGVAVITAIQSAEDVAGATRALVEAIAKGEV